MKSAFDLERELHVTKQQMEAMRLQSIEHIAALNDRIKDLIFENERLKQHRNAAYVDARRDVYREFKARLDELQDAVISLDTKGRYSNLIRR
jgi:predicted nuclease with TOPRIM domain